MSSAWSALIPLLGVAVSAAIGGLTVWLAVRKRLEEESLGRATRRTTALQLLSDEEFTLEQVRDECVAIDTIISIGSFDTNREHLQNEAKRIRSEASAMLDEVRDRRRAVTATLGSLDPSALESVIATAYHGKRRAETQLKRTQLSRTEVLKLFQSGEPHQQ